jgi:flagellar motor switch protein FliN
MADEQAGAAGGGAEQAKGASGAPAAGSPVAPTVPPTGGEGDAALKAAQEAISKAREANASATTAAGAPAPDPTKPTPLSVPTFGAGNEAGTAGGIDLLGDVNLNVKIELGRTKMLVEDVLRLAEGSVVELDKLAGDPVDVYVNDRHVARGEVLVLNDNFCVRISEITGAAPILPHPTVAVTAAATAPAQQAA